MSNTLVLITGRTRLGVRFRIRVCSGIGNPGPRPRTQACQPFLRTRTTMERRTQSVQLHQFGEYLSHVTFAICRTSTCRGQHYVSSRLRVSVKIGLWTREICRSQHVISRRTKYVKIWHSYFFPQSVRANQSISVL